MLFQNKRTWDIKLKYVLWAYMVTIKRSIGTSPFQLVYGIDAIFPIQLSFPVINFFQYVEEEPDEMKRRMFPIVKLQQERKAIMEKTESYKNKVNESFDKKKFKKDTLLVCDAVLNGMHKMMKKVSMKIFIIYGWDLLQ